jgi:hypothetical protein
MADNSIQQNTTRRIKRVALLIGVILFSVAITVPFFFSQYQMSGGLKTRQLIHTHDMAAHLKMMDQFDRSLRSGLVEPRWFSEVNNGYGSATFIFYPRIFYYLTSLTNLAAHDWQTTLLVISIIALVCSGFAFYWLSRLFYGPVPSAIAGVLYMLMPYHQLDLYWRGAVPEYIGFVLLPLILRFAIKVAKDPSPVNYASLGFFYGIHMMTHLPVGLMYSYAMVLFALSWSYKARDPRITLRIGAGMALGVILSATYWFPALIESRYIYEPASTIFPYHQLYIQTAIGANTFDDLISLSFKLTVLLVLASALVLKARVRKDSVPGDAVEQKLWVDLWLIMGSSALFLCTALSYDVSRLLPKIQAAVPPFRWLSIATMFACLLLAASVEQIRYKMPGVVRVAALAFVVGFNLWLCFDGVIAGSMSNGAQMVPASLLDAGFIPAGAKMPQLLEDTPKVELEPKGGLSEIQSWEPESRRIKVLVNQPSRVRLKTYNYRGWTATLDGQPAKIESDSDGIQTLDLPAGPHTIETSFRNTWPRTAGRVISLVGLAAIISLAIRGRRVKATADSSVPGVAQRGIALLKRRNALLFVSGGVLVLVAALIIAASLRSPTNQQKRGADAGSSGSTNQSENASPVDADATLFIQGVSTVSVAQDEQTLNQLLDALARRDSSRLQDLAQSGKVLSVENRTRVRVLQRTSGKIRVRIAEGKYQWAEGWALEAWVR